MDQATGGFQVLPGISTHLGGLEIRRLLPTRARRIVGAWCFLDRFGPLEFGQGKPMDVPPHPHIGLQTVTWLFEGEVFHRDSLGYAAAIRPGQLNLMTSGRGIAHSEETPERTTGQLNGVQFWVALPDAHRQDSPSFEHHEVLPQVEVSGAEVTLILGQFGGCESPAAVYSPIVGLDVRLSADSLTDLELNAEFEHALLLVHGDVIVETAVLQSNALLFSPAGRRSVRLKSRSSSRAIIIGGEPFREPLLMWWNFVARTTEEIEQARADWEEGRRFGEVQGYPGGRLSAPPFIARPVRPQA